MADFRDLASDTTVGEIYKVHANARVVVFHYDLILILTRTF